MQRSSVINRKKALQVLKELDAFPKVSESYQQTSASGGGVSLVVLLAVIVLVLSEISYYTATELKFDYVVDNDYESKLKINIDMTVAMPCSNIGADVLDLTGQNVHTFGQLAEEDVYFELSPNQRQFLRTVQNFNSYIKEEYHAIHDVLWRAGFGGLTRNMPPREDTRTDKKDGCRLHGTLSVNKVAGNFHITAGKSLPSFGQAHMHLNLNTDKDYNFSHRIERFSYGEFVAGIINPLDGEEKTTDENYHMFQYFVQVVPTEVDTRMSQVDTYQYAVTERNRTIDHKEGSHGVPGIFVKYDLNPLKVKVKEVHRPYWQFIVRMCGIIGGIFATSGILHSVMGLLADALCCRLKLWPDTSASAGPTTQLDTQLSQPAGTTQQSVLLQQPPTTS